MTDGILLTLMTPDGVALHVRRWPRPDARASMLIVNGLSDHLGRWRHVVEFFGGYDVVSYDHRGHGRSAGARIDIDRFDRLVDDLGLVLDRTREEGTPLVVYAHSMGGLVATLYAVSGRPQPDAYVLSAPALDAAAPAALRVAVRLLARAVPGLRVGSTIRGDQLARDPGVGEAYFSDPLVVTKGTVRFGAALLEAMGRARAAAGQLAVPTLVIHGGDDTIVPPAASAPLAASPAVERRLFPGLRHEMHNEPEGPEVLAAVQRWLEDRLADQASP